MLSRFSPRLNACQAGLTGVNTCQIIPFEAQLNVRFAESVAKLPAQILRK